MTFGLRPFPAVGWTAAVLLATTVHAERLPVRVYGENEGLAGDHVRCILQDSRGFLWFATNSGVSTFDGQRFLNYGVADGLPAPAAMEVVEGGDGRIYVLSDGRVARTRAAWGADGPAFESLPVPDLFGKTGDIQALVQAPDGAIVLAADRGVFRFVTGQAEARLEVVDIGEPPGSASDPYRAVVWAATFDRQGTLWVTRAHGVSSRDAQGKVRTWPFPPGRAIGPGWGWYPKMTADRSGRVWLLTTGDGLWRIDTEASAGGEIIAEILDPATGIPSRFPRALEEDADGTLWIGTSNEGLVRCHPRPAGMRCEALRQRQGLPDVGFFALLRDDEENLWCGTLIAGAVRIAAEGMVSWGEDEGLSPPSITAIQNGDDSRPLFQMGLHFATLSDAGVTSWPIRTVTPLADHAWGSQQTLARDLDGRLWLATGDGAYIYAAGTRSADLATKAPDRVVTTRDGLAGNDIFRIHVDHTGDIWLGTINASEGICRYRRGDGSIQCFGASAGIPSTGASAFAEDAAGNMWVGFYGQGLYRLRAGRFETWPEVGPERPFSANSFARDATGNLWAAGHPGLLKIGAPESDHPAFRRFDSTNGLSSTSTNGLAFDRFGRLYVGGSHGMDRLDLDKEVARTFTMADGLPSNRIGVLYVDPAGIIWIGTSRGVARLVPRKDRVPLPPRVFITAVRVAGVPQAPVEGSLRLASNDTNLEFSFTSPSFRAGERMRFRTRLLGDNVSWGPASEGRTVAVANLSPGRYRFQVEAIDGDGVTSAEPAEVAFTIPPPFWKQAWFLALAVSASAGAGALFYRARVQRAVALERVRTRIAIDLHDDIGSSLTHIAILGQLARRQAEQDDSTLVESLDRITESSGELVDVLGDVVWAVNPVHDRLGDLVHRMRRFASELFADSGISLQMELPPARPEQTIGADPRRQIYLIFKEALHNALRHSGARCVWVALRRDGPGWTLSIRDDGRGIPAAGQTEGHGLDSMRARAEAMGARIEIVSAHGAGTEIVVRTGQRGFGAESHSRG